MQTVTDLGRPLTWWVVHILAVVVLLVHRNLREALFVAVTAAGGGTLTSVIKSIVGRPRPDWSDPVSAADGFAFPSGHTTGTAIGISILLIIVLPRLSVGWRWALTSLGVILVIAVAASRVVLGVHWVSDVLGALLLSAAWVLIMLRIFLLGRRPPSGPEGGKLLPS